MSLKTTEDLDLFMLNSEGSGMFGLMSKSDYVYMGSILEYMKRSGSGKAYISDLAEYFSLPVSKVSKRVRKLEDKGYLSWLMDDDKERTYVEVTNIARELIAEQDEKMEKCRDIMEEEIPEDELDITVKTLAKIRRIVERYFEGEENAEEE